MITSVYLSNNILHIVTGERKKGLPAVQQTYSVEIPEGSLLNGLITNEQELVEQLKEIWENNHLPASDVELVVDTSKFVTKQVSLPKQKEKHLLENLAREYSDVERRENAVYDYMVIGENKGTKLREMMAVMTDSDYLEGILKVFREAGISVKSITTARSNAVKLLPHILNQGNTAKTCILQVLVGSTLTSLLWIDGTYTYANKKRLFCERGTDQFAVEVIRNINSMVQFHSSLKSDSEIKNIYLCGFTQEEIGSCQEAAGQFELGMEVAALDYEYRDYLYAAGSLTSIGKDINLLAAMKKKKKAKNGGGAAALKPWIPVFVLLGICLIASTVLIVMVHMKQSTVDEYEEYLTDPANLSSVMEADTISAQNSWMQSVISETDQMQEIIASYPKVTSKVWQAIENSGDGQTQAEILSYDSATGVLDMRLTSTVVTSPNQYADALEATGLFHSVEYTGYSKEGSQKAKEEAGQTYTVNISCTLNESAGK
ncbi:MAG: type IV pilus biogenesis protein PilM [Blautia sp.]|jgi:Tfp pilus assembly PilM family ATPase